MIKHLVQVDLREIQPATDLNSLHYATGLSHNKVARGHPCRTKHSDRLVLIGTRIPVSQGLIAVRTAMLAGTNNVQGTLPTPFLTRTSNPI